MTPAPVTATTPITGRRLTDLAHLTPIHSQPTAPSEKGNTMIKLLLTLNLWGIALLDRTIGRAGHALQTARRHGVSPSAGLRSRRQRDERGSVTIEQVIWAGAVIVIVGIVVAAITAYVKSESAKIK
jgi:hypothetical protein